MSLHVSTKSVLVVFWSALSAGLCEVRRLAGMEPNSEAGPAFRDERSLDASPEASDTW